jgi:hypothetical protein
LIYGLNWPRTVNCQCIGTSYQALQQANPVHQLWRLATGSTRSRMTLSRHEPVKDAFEVSESAPARTAAPPIAARASRRERPAWLRWPMDPSTSCRSAGVIRIRRCLYEKMQTDPHFSDYILFHEYCDGDNGRGLGASHQTGWSGLVANMIAELHE